MVRKFIQTYGFAIICLIAAIFYVSTADAKRPGDGGSTTPNCTINPSATTITVDDSVSFSATLSGIKGKKSYTWTFIGGSQDTSSSSSPTVTYPTEGSLYGVSLEVTGNGSTALCDTTVTVIAAGTGDPPPVFNSDISINSTSQNGIPTADVTEQLFAGNTSYKIFGANDLGMHCGDFDTRISSILPPFNVKHAQVIRRGAEPDILTPADGISVVYSAASNPGDPILTGINSAGTGPVLSSVTPNGVYKTNFWDIALDAYRPFYPPGILDALAPEPDEGLPMPNVERLYLGDGALTAEKQSMPGRSAPYMDNTAQTFSLFTTDQPFFTTFPFGYVATSVNWFEAAGVPFTAFDDAGRENPWPLSRFQAHDSSGNVLASTDVVIPISGEANCGACHNARVDGGNGAATDALGDSPTSPGPNVATVLDDPEFDSTVPLEVSKEYAADLNILRLHDLRHGSGNAAGPKYTPDLVDQTPVVCQSCHYTPALDLAQVGPKGPGDADANGRQQTNVRSMSNVMHSHHATVTGTDGAPLFPTMPPAVNGDGSRRDPVAARDTLMNTCYQCHPGRRTDCLRGAMASGGLLCQDCHGDMQQVGNDFSKDVSPSHPGDFHLAADFYTNPATLRVPWANEPGCGSCHTGDATDNLHADSDTLGNPDDGIRLMQAYRIGDTKATPIVPANKRFAENVVASGLATGNPMLFRVSKGHEGVFCEACHGSTHAIWPNANPDANDNVAANQLQGHAGTITECGTCHTSTFSVDDFKGHFDSSGLMPGPHGSHPFGTAMWNQKHKEVFNDGATPSNTCESCHGSDGLGTVLSATATDRVFQCKERGTLCTSGDSTINVPKGTQIGCVECHDNEIGRRGD